MLKKQPREEKKQHREEEMTGNIMNKSQRIRAIFENNVSKMQSPEQQEYEAWKLKQHKEKTKSGETAAGIRRGQHVTPGNQADKVYGGRDHMGHLRVTPAQLQGQRLRMSLQHHVDRLKGSNPELAAKYRNLGAKRGMQLASTDHYRAGLRALFESVLDEADIYQKSARVPSHINPVKASSVLIKKMSKSSKPGMSQQDADKAARAGIAKSNSYKALKGMAARKRMHPYDYDYDMYYESKTERDPFGKPDPNDPKDFGIKPLPKAPKIKFKPKPANMPRGPKAVVKPSQLFQRDPLDP